jgi:hypothetical protein
MFSVISLGPTANADLVPKFHVALLAYHAALPILTSKFRPTLASRLSTLTFHRVLPSPGLMSELGVLIECSETLLNSSPCSTFHLYLLYFRTSYLFSNLPLSEGRTGIAWGPS